MRFTYRFAQWMTAFTLLGLVCACSAILDTENFSKNAPSEDKGVLKDGTNGGKDSTTPEDSPKPPVDNGVCENGEPCTVSGAKGKCKYGKLKCSEGGVTAVCEAQYQPAQETCDGPNEIHDQNCNGVRDDSDSEAHQACGSGKYCNPSSKDKCVSGCWKDDQCKGTTSKCVEHVCKCGSKNACKQPNPVCKVDKCQCDDDSNCNAHETCSNGHCNCGDSVGPAAGPFCTEGTCASERGQCEGAPLPDAAVPDQMLPDAAVPDQPPASDAVAPE